MEEGLMELYSQLHATGCFKCSTSGNSSSTYNYDYADDTECVDLCSPAGSDPPLTSTEWREFFITSFEKDQQMTID